MKFQDYLWGSVGMGVLALLYFLIWGGGVQESISTPAPSVERPVRILSDCSEDFSAGFDEGLEIGRFEEPDGNLLIQWCSQSGWIKTCPAAPEVLRWPDTGEAVDWISIEEITDNAAEEVRRAMAATIEQLNNQIAELEAASAKCNRTHGLKQQRIQRR